MNASQWEQVKSLFLELRALPSDGWGRLLEVRCDDRLVRSEVRSLLEADALESPVDSLFARLGGLPLAAGSADGTGPARIDRYEIERELGRGGMGVVYRARDPRLERTVALKVLSPGSAGSPGAAARLLAEARAASALDHPNICTILEAGQAEGGGLFITMPFYAGETLQQVIARGPVHAARAVEIAAQVAEGLACAHAAGIVHRDIKPGNLLVTEQGPVKILDFGVARAADRPDLTEPGARVGTLGYMAPEVVRGGVADARADVWALGVVLYEMLTGERPFVAADRAALAAAILDGRARPLAEVAPGAPPALHRLVASALRPDPAERVPTAAAFLDALRGIDDAAGGPTLPLALRPLPAAVTELVGRDRELEAVAALLAETRLLTLTGPGGSGKTRLAVEAGRRTADGYRDGCCLVELAPVGAAELVLSAIASALGLHDSGSGTIEPIADALRGRSILLILDNFEHVLAAAPHVSALLRAAPGLRILTTSRAPLRIAGEREFEVPPLDRPARDASDEPDRLLAYDAVRLFVLRARAIDAEFELTPANAPDVVRLCDRLDGLPLAIELAAARVRLLPPDRILERLETRLDLLSGGGRDLPSRQRTLQRAIGWSYDLLDPFARSCFERLSVFAGGFTLEAAEAVCAELTDDPVAILDALEDLVEHSLVRRRSDGDGPRFGLLQTIRAFAAEKLEAAGTAERTRLAHARHFVEVAEGAEPALTGEGQAETLTRLDREHPNLRAALGSALDRRDARLALRLVAALWRYWIARGLIEEGLALAGRALDLPEPSPDVRLRARALMVGGSLAHNLGENRRARGWLEEALTLWRALEDEQGVASALIALGWVACELCDVDTGEALSREGLELAKALGNERDVALAVNNLGWVAMYRGDGPSSRELHAESMRIRRRIGDTRGVAFALANLGYAHLMCGDLESAARAAEEAIAELEPLNDRMLTAWALMTLARATRRMGDSARARALAYRAIHLARTCGNPSVLAGTQTIAAALHLDAGETAEALRLLEPALRIWRHVDSPLGGAQTLVELGRAAELEGRLEDALASYRAALDPRRRIGDPQSVRECEQAIERLDGAVAAAAARPPAPAPAPHR